MNDISKLAQNFQNEVQPIYPDSMTTLGQRSILVSRFVGSTLADYVGPTSTCSLGHRRANTLG